MRPEHEAWIAAYRDRCDTLGRCNEATQEMRAAFPGLRRVGGHALCVWGRRQHWWLEDADGSVVDPTEDQFPGGVAEYEEYVDGQPLRVATCADCGGGIFVHSMAEVGEFLRGPGRAFCSDACRDSTIAYLYSETRPRL